MAAARRTRRKAEGSDSAAKSAEELVGQDYLTANVHVVRDGKTVTIKGGRMLSDAEDKLSDAEAAPLRASGVIRPATDRDAQQALATVQREDAEEAQADATAKRDALNTKQASEREAIIRKHDAAKQAELSELSATHSEEQEALDAEIAGA